MSARSKARKRALDVLFESEQRGVDVARDAGRPGRGRRPAGVGVHGGAGRGRGGAPGPDRRAAHDLLPGLVAGPDAGRRPRGAAAGRPSSCSGSTTSRTPWSSTEAVRAGPQPVHRRLAGLRQRRPRRGCCDLKPSAGRPDAVRVDADGTSSSVSPGARARRVRVEHAPGDELLGELARGLVVDDGQGAQVVLPDRQHPAVVVAALGLDGRRVAGQRSGLLGRHRPAAAPGR